jgi:dTDP-glucose 4,6-dehydratase
MKTYLVTGAAGFIGANFIKYLLKKYKDDEIKIIVLDALTYAGNLGTIKDDIDNKRCFFVKGNICDRKLADQLFTENDIDYVINFAAESHVDRSIEDPQLFLTVNILGCQNLMDAARKAWVTGKDAQGYPTWKAGKRFHQVSTDEVYGSLGSTGYFTEETPLSPHSPYSASKASADFVVKAYHDTFHLPCTITRCSNNYGPYQFPEKLIPLMINNVLEGKKLPVYGKGLNIRDWLYVDDHCKAIDMVVRHGRDGQAYNIGGHNEMRNIDIVKLIIRTVHDLMAKDPSLRNILHDSVKKTQGTDNVDWINDNLIEHVTDRLGHDRRYAIDPTKAKKELGWYPETRFADGIKKTIAWNLDNQKWIKEVTSGDYQKYYDIMYGKNRHGQVL